MAETPGAGKRGWSDATLLLVGHGSRLNSASSRAARLVADDLKERALFGEVRAAFLRDEPPLRGALQGVETPIVYVVPYFACRGHMTAQVIPAELGLEGPAADRVGGEGGRQRILVCDPVGDHPRVPAIVAGRVRRVMADHRLVPERTRVMIVGHGTDRDTESERRTREVALALRDHGVEASAEAAFIEQEPLVDLWAERSPATDAIMVPYFMSLGYHVADDIPARLGLNPDDPGLARLGREWPAAGPYEVSGRRLWYTRAVGYEPEMADLVVETVAAMDRSG